MSGNDWREWREASGLSLRKFAKLIDVSPTYVSRVETGEEPHCYSRQTTMRAAIVLGLNREQRAEALSFWRAFYMSEVLAIDVFVSDGQEVTR